MDCTATNLSYIHTGFFSKIIIDYLNQDANLKKFYAHPVSYDGLAEAIKQRKSFKTDRHLLVSELRKQYSQLQQDEKVEQNLTLLLKENTFTITTAHQPAIFTGPLYFIYKIVHAIKLASELSAKFPQEQFVPVYYMGSEDADLDELGNFYLDGVKITWEANQTGAVGRMQTAGLEKIVDRIEGELGVLPFGEELTAMLRYAYLESPDVQTATLRLIHSLFASFGLIVVIPDNPAFKQLMKDVFIDDLFQHTPQSLVEETASQLNQSYKVQANPREVNLFYLKENIRGRIEKSGDRFYIHDADTWLTEQEIRDELQNFPERFSPNVILRGLFQSTLLPDIAFIGGGGETAYWLELKNLFTHYHVPYPVLVLRNSFLLVEGRWKDKMEKLGLKESEIFKPADELLNELVRNESSQQLSLAQEIKEADGFYARLKQIAAQVDPTIVQHVDALHAGAVKPLHELEKKLLKAEKRKFSEQQKAIQLIKSKLFPENSLQERIDNFMPWYARWGKDFIRLILEHSFALDQEFVLLCEKAEVASLQEK